MQNIPVDANIPVPVSHLAVHKRSARAVRTGEIFQGLLPKGLIHETPVTHLDVARSTRSSSTALMSLELF